MVSIFPGMTLDSMKWSQRHAPTQRLIMYAYGVVQGILEGQQESSGNLFVYFVQFLTSRMACTDSHV